MLDGAAAIRFAAVSRSLLRFAALFSLEEAVGLALRGAVGVEEAVEAALRRARKMDL